MKAKEEQKCTHFFNRPHPCKQGHQWAAYWGGAELHAAPVTDHFQEHQHCFVLPQFLFKVKVGERKHFVADQLTCSDTTQRQHEQLPLPVHRANGWFGAQWQETQKKRHPPRVYSTMLTNSKFQLLNRRITRLFTLRPMKFRPHQLLSCLYVSTSETSAQCRNLLYNEQLRARLLTSAPNHTWLVVLWLF